MLFNSSLNIQQIDKSHDGAQNPASLGIVAQLHLMQLGGLTKPESFSFPSIILNFLWQM